MAGFDDTSDLPEGGQGEVRLFPLPNLVLFPHVLQPLHVFEPRYCTLLEDALASDRIIATALLEPGWEKDYDGAPPIAPTICVGRVVSHAREGSDRHNILLLGLRRARIRYEFPNSGPYRRAQVRFVSDFYDTAAAEQRHQLKRQLVETFRSWLPGNQAVEEQFHQLLKSQVPLGVLTDIVAFTVNLELRVKQQLLHQLNVDRRAVQLLGRLRKQQPEQVAGRRAFPPEFSRN